MTVKMLLPCIAAWALCHSTVAESAATAGVMLQIASFSNAREAEAAAARFNTAALGGLMPQVRSVDLAGKGTFYRVLVGPFADRSAADRACATLKAAGVACIIAPAEVQAGRPPQQATAVPATAGAAGTNLRASITAPAANTAASSSVAPLIPVPPPTTAPAPSRVLPPAPAPAAAAMAPTPPPATAPVPPPAAVSLTPPTTAAAPPPPPPPVPAPAAPVPASAQQAAASPPADTEFTRTLRAAEQGDARAQLQLGGFYLTGRGVRPDEAASLRWFRIAAENGLAEAQFEVGKAYDMGRGGPRDPLEAARWYRLAAQQGHGRAQYNLGSMHGNGEGVPVDYLRAYMWFTISERTLAGAEQESARAAKGQAERLMMPADLGRAADMAQRCIASAYRNCD